MNTLRWLSCCALSIMCGLSFASSDWSRPNGVEATQLQRGALLPPREIVAAWWLGEPVTADSALPCDRFHEHPRFAKWNMGDVLPAPRRLLSYADNNDMVTNDHVGQVMCCRRHLLTDPALLRRR